MYKKIFILFIFSILIFTLSSPVTLSAENNNGNDKIKPLFAPSPMIDLIYEPLNEPVIPNSGVYQIPLKINYRLIGIFSFFQLMFIRNAIVQIELTILETDPWCTASIDNAISSININNNNGTEATLKISVNEKAPAFTQGRVRIQVTSSAIKGLIFKKVNSGEFEFDIVYVVGYLPLIKYEVEKNYYEIPQSSVTTVPVRIKNLGNGATFVKIEMKDKPLGWNVTYSEGIVINSPLDGGDNYAEVNFHISPLTSFKTDTMVIKFTPNYKGRPDFKGQSEIITLTFKNDGSFENNQGNIFSLTSFAIFSLIGLGTVFFFINKKKKNSS